MIDSVELWVSTDSLMVSPIDFRRMSSVRTWPIVLSKFSFGHPLTKVVQNTSLLASRLESSVRAFTSSSKLIHCEESLDNTQLKVLMWEFTGLVSLILIVNNFRINMSFDEEDCFS